MEIVGWVPWGSDPMGMRCKSQKSKVWKLENGIIVWVPRNRRVLSLERPVFGTTVQRYGIEASKKKGLRLILFGGVQEFEAGGLFGWMAWYSWMKKKRWIRMVFWFMWCRILGIWRPHQQVSLSEMKPNNFHVGWRICMTSSCLSTRIVSGSLLLHRQFSRVVPCESWRLHWRRCHLPKKSQGKFHFTNLKTKTKKHRKSPPKRLLPYFFGVMLCSWVGFFVPINHLDRILQSTICFKALKFTWRITNHNVFPTSRCQNRRKNHFFLAAQKLRKKTPSLWRIRGLKVYFPAVRRGHACLTVRGEILGFGYWLEQFSDLPTLDARRKWKRRRICWLQPMPPWSHPLKAQGVLGKERFWSWKIAFRKRSHSDCWNIPIFSRKC